MVTWPWTKNVVYIYDINVYCLREFGIAFYRDVGVKREKRRQIVLMVLDSRDDLYAGDASGTSALRQHLRQ